MWQSHFFTFSTAIGFLLAWYLGIRQENHLANRLLAIWIFLLSVDSLFISLIYHEVFYEYPHIVGVTTFFPILYGPLFYLYARSLTQTRRLTVADALHFFPFLTAFFLTINTFFLFNEDDKIRLMENLIHHVNVPWNYEWGFFLVTTVSPLYVLWAIYLLFIYRRELNNQLSTIGESTLNWLWVMSFLNVVIWLTVIGNKWSTYSENDFLHSWFHHAPYIGTAIFMYCTAYFSLKQPQVFQVSFDKSDSRPLTDKEKYGVNRLPEKLQDSILTDIQELIEQQQLFLDPQLSLAKLADVSHVSTHQLSQVINDQLSLNFYDFINQYRINFVKSEFKRSPEEGILAVALRSGFNSKSTFNSAFKKFTGVTPSQYRKQQ